MAVSHWVPCTGHCICYCFPKHHGSFMYRNSAGSPALFFSISYNILSPPRRKEAFPAEIPAGSADRSSLCAFYCTFGDILSNLLWCGMMILVSYRSIHGLVYAETQTGKGRNLRYFHIGILCYVAVEYALWTSGCFWPGDSIFSPYCWCDLLLTFCLFGLLPATGKAVRT